MTRVYSFLIPEQVPALKNDREIKTDRKGKFRGTRPSKEVEQFVLKTKDKLYRLLPQDFEVIRRPQEVAVVMLRGVYSAGYPNTLPSSDDDNAFTTMQECLFTARTVRGPLIQDDCQVAEHIVKRLIFKSPEAVYNRLWVWEIRDDYRSIEAEVLKEVNKLVDDNRAQWRNE